jgi:hypothetical protein
VNRAGWQQIAEEKLLAASVLLAASQWSAAYYLAGYAIECGLKSCILARVARSPEVIFETKTYSEKCWKHDAAALVELAGLKLDLDAAGVVEPALEVNWLAVCQWSEATRYKSSTQAEAQSLFDAITEPVNGVMQWIRARW